MITSLIFWIVKIILGILAVVFGFLIGLALLGVTIPTGICYKTGRLYRFIFKNKK